MKYWIFVLIPVLALSLGCGKPYVMGTPIDKSRMAQIVPGASPEAKVTEIFGEPFKKEMVEGDMTKYTYTYYMEEPRFWSKNKVTKQTLDVYTKDGLVRKYDLKNEGISLGSEEAEDDRVKEQDRKEILAMKDLTLAELYKHKPKAKEVIEKSEGYAVFDATGVYVVLYVGIEGRGVLIDNSNGEATYMVMARVGTGPGVGYEKFRGIIVFKSKKVLHAFKTVGGDIGASGHLVVKEFNKGGGVGFQVSFDPELSMYQITESGLAAEISWGATAFLPDPTLKEAAPVSSTAPGSPTGVKNGQKENLK